MTAVQVSQLRKDFLRREGRLRRRRVNALREVTFTMKRGGSIFFPASDTASATASFMRAATWPRRAT